MTDTKLTHLSDLSFVGDILIPEHIRLKGPVPQGESLGEHEELFSEPAIKKNEHVDYHS